MWRTGAPVPDPSSVIPPQVIASSPRARDHIKGIPGNRARGRPHRRPPETLDLGRGIRAVAGENRVFCTGRPARTPRTAAHGARSGAALRNEDRSRATPAHPRREVGLEQVAQAASPRANTASNREPAQPLTASTNGSRPSPSGPASEDVSSHSGRRGACRGARAAGRRSPRACSSRRYPAD